MSDDKKFLQREGSDERTAEVLSETEEYYWVVVVNEDGSWEQDSEPFTIAKDNQWWKVKLPEPRAGDIWASPYGGGEYRVLGVDYPRNQMLIVLKESYAEGTWPTVVQGAVQENAEVKFKDVFIRELPETYLKLKRRAS